MDYEAEDAKDSNQDQLGKTDSFAIFHLKLVIFHSFLMRAVLREDVKIRQSS